MNFQEILQRIEQMAAGANRGVREARSEIEQLRGIQSQHYQQLQQLLGFVQGMKVNGGGGKGGPSTTQVGRPDMLSIEEIPGRRIPFDVTIQIGVPASQTSPLTGNYTISMDGPFVVVARSAAFISSYAFQVTDGTSVQRYSGRSWGRQRPISSVLDLMDANTGWVDGTSTTFDGDCDPTAPDASILSRPASRSPFRTMEYDGYVQLKSAVFPRQNAAVPTSLWAPGFNQMFQLPVLDYWEKGDVMEVEIEPLHVNNPAAGSIQTLLGAMPYLAGQYDGHEGVGYPSYECDASATDTIQRRPDGIFVVGFHGFRILQPPGIRLR